MFHTGKCPHCGKTPSYIGAQDIEVKVGPLIGDHEIYKGVTFYCPLCNSILSASIDPIALKNDIAATTAKLLRKGSR